MGKSEKWHHWASGCGLLLRPFEHSRKGKKNNFEAPSPNGMKPLMAIELVPSPPYIRCGSTGPWLKVAGRVSQKRGKGDAVNRSGGAMGVGGGGATGALGTTLVANGVISAWRLPGEGGRREARAKGIGIRWKRWESIESCLDCWCRRFRVITRNLLIVSVGT